ncbi:MAG: carboxylating nicotinate-nucleotide diphosphorylase [Candidatus Omnitrophica bacterium]|nr:carboxylating nicotinate-nucleotide diphosphorylase [Candidatus Omnitrophota bacterium]
MQLDKERVIPIIKSALKEDIGKADLTTGALIDKFTTSSATVITKEDCVVCGLQVAEWTMAQVDYSVRFKPNCKDGSLIGSSKDIVFLDGHANAILRAERTMLNFLTFLSGIATKTRQFVDKAKPYGVKIMDTRKTMPLLRYLEKYAVFTGGGTNHRMGLYDQVLIKDNHIKAYREKDGLKALVEAARKKNAKGTIIEIEVTNIEEFNEALAGKPDIIMLDNMSPREVGSCVEIRRLSKIKPLLEVSGGIDLENVEEYAKTKVDVISVGSLTNSVKAVDMSLEIV